MAEKDEIYPTHMLDNLPQVKPLVMTWTMQFNDCLDPSKLHLALSRLLELGDWKKFGGRLRTNSGGRGKALEIHVPARFTAERPAVNFTRETFNVKVTEHSIGKKLPRATEHVSIQYGPPDVRAIAAPPDAPSTVKDFTSTNTPMLHLHVVSFEDATIVTLIWPHVLFDAGGFAHLLQSWSLVLAGRETEVPSLLGSKEDVVYGLADLRQPNPEYAAAASRILTGFAFILFLLRFIWNILTGSAVVSKTICVPKEKVARLHQQALAEIHNGKDATNELWVSHSDVLLAWICRMLALSQSRPRPMSIANPVNLRTRLGELQHGQGVYVQNLLAATSTAVSVDDLKSSLGHLALKNRTGLLEQLGESRLIAMVQCVRERWDHARSMVMILAQPGSEYLVSNNRIKVNVWDDADFGPAVLKPSPSTVRGAPPGRPVYHFAVVLTKSMMMRNFINIHTRDRDGNYWLTGYFTETQWKSIQAGIKE